MDTLFKELEGKNVGLLCVTRENYDKPWINFEAGALAKNYTTARVCPILIDLHPADITGPLTAFQMKRLIEGDVVGEASTDPLHFSNDPDNPIICSGDDPNNTGHLLFLITLNLPVDNPNIGESNGTLVVGMQGTGSLDQVSTEDLLLWKVVSISGQPPPSWRSMDIFQDVPAPSGDSAVA